MKAVDFVKKFGWGHSKTVSNGWITNYENVDLNDLKRLVDAWELVEGYSGLDRAKTRCYPTKHLTMDSYHVLKQAIQLVESCQ